MHTVEQADRAVEQGADILIAQGGEAGGFCGEVATMALVPQVVDAVAPVPCWPRAASPTDAAWPPRSSSAPPA